MAVPAAQPPESKGPPRARMARWPSPMLVIVIALWVVPGAVMFSPTAIGAAALDHCRRWAGAAKRSVGPFLSLGRRRWTVTAVRRGRLTTALDRYCREPDASRP